MAWPDTHLFACNTKGLRPWHPEAVALDAETLTDSLTTRQRLHVKCTRFPQPQARARGQAAAPGESMEFLAQIRGWKSEARKQRRDQLLQLNDIGLRMALTSASGTDIFFILEVHFTGETPEQDDKGWWYQVLSVIWCRECLKCGVRKEQAEFERNEWHKEKPSICDQCVTGRDAGQASTSTKDVSSTPSVCWTRWQHLWRRGGVHHTGD
jgi:hypothetical protein